MGLVHLADEDLMQLVRRGDAAAFELVYDRHATAAFSLAYRMTGTRNAVAATLMPFLPRRTRPLRGVPRLIPALFPR